MKDKEILQKALMKAQLAWELADEINWYELIFRHEFAKAFWGTDYFYKDENQLFDSRRKWEYHLQQMILEEEPFKYLERFL